jgi:hypothetical protein
MGVLYYLGERRELRVFGEGRLKGFERGRRANDREFPHLFPHPLENTQQRVTDITCKGGEVGYSRYIQPKQPNQGRNPWTLPASLPGTEKDSRA